MERNDNYIFGIISIIIGIASLLLPYPIAIIPAIIGLLIGTYGLFKDKKMYIALIGMIICAIVFIYWILWFIALREGRLA